MADAKQLLEFAKSKGLAVLSMWAIQRDNGGCPGTSGADDCSGIAQSDAGRSPRRSRRYQGSRRRVTCLSRQPTETTNLNTYGDAPLEWSRVLDALNNPPPQLTHFLGTVGRTAGLTPWALGPCTTTAITTSLPDRKPSGAHNLASNSACTLAVQLTGIDVVFEGTAARVTDADTLERLAAQVQRLGLAGDVEAMFSRPHTAPPAQARRRWNLYRVTFDKVIAVATADLPALPSARFELVAETLTLTGRRASAGLKAIVASPADSSRRPNPALQQVSSSEKPRVALDPHATHCRRLRPRGWCEGRCASCLSVADRAHSTRRSAHSAC